jgi:hypothetical protein
MLSYTGDNTIESCWRRRYRDNLAVTWCRCCVILVTMLLSHTGDDAVGVTWLWHDVDAESCWRHYYQVTLATTLPSDLATTWCSYRVMLATMLPRHAGWRRCRCDLAATWCRYQDMLATMLLSHAGDDGAGVTWLRCDVYVESCWRQCCQVMLATTLPGRLGRGAM